MIVESINLSKSFGDFIALSDVSFSIDAGEIVGLIGPNGAGKSTAVHLLLGLITRTAGALRIFGSDPEVHRGEVLARLNFTSPYMGLPPRLTVRENLAIYARLYGVSRVDRKVAELLDELGAGQLADKPSGRLSSGETARVMLCKALLNDPELLVLDEPTANLDPPTADMIMALLERRRRERNTAVLLTSHNLAQVEALCDRIVVIDGGRVVATGTTSDVTRALLGETNDRASLSDAFRTLVGAREAGP